MGAERGRARWPRSPDVPRPSGPPRAGRVGPIVPYPRPVLAPHVGRRTSAHFPVARTNSREGYEYRRDAARVMLVRAHAAVRRARTAAAAARLRRKVCPVRLASRRSES